MNAHDNTQNAGQLLLPDTAMLLASANRMLSDRLERVAHVLRGCGLPALANISGGEDLQMATAALSGAYQVALAEYKDLARRVEKLESELKHWKSNEHEPSEDADLPCNEFPTEGVAA